MQTSKAVMHQISSTPASTSTGASRRIFFISLAVLAALLPVRGVGQDTHPSLLVHYEFDVTMGLVATDSSGNGYHGELQNFAEGDAHWVAGTNGGALLMPGTTDQVEVPPLPWISNSTWAAWVRLDAVRTRHSLITATFPGATAGHLLQTAGGDSGPSHVQVLWNHNLGAVRILSPQSLETGAWYHIAMTADADAEQFNLYINGVLAGTTNGAPIAYQTLRLGRRASTSDNPLVGAMDEFRVYTRALGAAEIRELAGLTEPQAPTILRQPRSQTVRAGSPASFSVLAAGDSEPLAYQWWHKGTVLLPDATNATLTLENVSFDDAGSYHVVVSNTVGQTPSDPAMLFVVPEGPAGLLVEYLFEQTNGLTATDTSGNGWHGDLGCSPIRSRIGLRELEARRSPSRT